LGPKVGRSKILANPWIILRDLFDPDFAPRYRHPSEFFGTNGGSLFWRRVARVLHDQSNPTIDLILL
jgi:hypothetical protein